MSPLQEELLRLGVYNTKVFPPPEGTTRLNIDMPPRKVRLGLTQGVSATIALTPQEYDRFVQYSAGLGVTPLILQNKEALEEGGFSEEYKNLLESGGMTSARIPPLRETLLKILKDMDLKKYPSELAKDETKRMAVSAVLTAYEALGKALLFSEKKHIVEAQRQALKRIDVLKGKPIGD
jgi:hypothetical protein